MLEGVDEVVEHDFGAFEHAAEVEVVALVEESVEVRFGHDGEDLEMQIFEVGAQLQGARETKTWNRAASLSSAGKLFIDVHTS